MNTQNDLDNAIDTFLKTVNLAVRKPEPTELVDDEDADRYNVACDYAENSDPGLIVEALKLEGGIRGKRILEIGFGPGYLCRELLEAGAAYVVGADPAQVMLAHARQKYSTEIKERKMNFVPTSVYDITRGFMGGFDLVVCQNSFHQLFEPQQALEGMINAIKQRGEVHIFDFRRDITSKLLAQRIRYTKPAIWQDLANSICAALTKEEVREYLNNIQGIKFTVANATNPAELSEQARELIVRDPVPHYKDYLISQRIKIHKL